MKTRIVHFLVVLTLVLSVPALLHAQMAIKEPLARVDIPFVFSAGGVHLPAGSYHISHPGDPYFVLIEKNDGRARALVYVQPSAINSSESTKLVFNKYGNQYFLSQLWTEPDQQVHQCFKSSMEKELMAQAQKSESVVVVAKR